MTAAGPVRWLPRVGSGGCALASLALATGYPRAALPGRNVRSPIGAEVQIDDATGWIECAIIRGMSLHVVLVNPEIHWNTGNSGRSCLAAGATLHLIEPLGFSLGEREVRRAGLDYWEHVELRVWRDWQSFERELPQLGEPYFFSTRAERMYWEADYGERTVLIFGRETGGLAESIHERYGQRMYKMPITSPHVRSLNLSTTVGIALYEVLRQRANGPAA